MLPPSVQDFVPAGHPAHLVREIVREEFDLSAILSAYTEARGFPPYHSGMMVALLLFAYSQGVYSSRRIARGCEERLDFQAVTALNRPDFRTISEFRRRHLVALGVLFVQVLALCQKAGLVGLGGSVSAGASLRIVRVRGRELSCGLHDGECNLCGPGENESNGGKADDVAGQAGSVQHAAAALIELPAALPAAKPPVALCRDLTTLRNPSRATANTIHLKFRLTLSASCPTKSANGRQTTSWRET